MPHFFLHGIGIACSCRDVVSVGLLGENKMPPNGLESFPKYEKRLVCINFFLDSVPTCGRILYSSSMSFWTQTKSCR